MARKSTKRKLPKKSPLPSDPLGVQPKPVKANLGRPPRERRELIDAVDSVRSNGRGANFPQIKLNVPSVAQFCAKVIVKHALDYGAAARELLQDHKVSEQVIENLSHNLQNSEPVGKALQEIISACGIDENSSKVYLREIWNWFLFGAPDQKIAAARLLRPAFIQEKVTPDKPEELPLAGLGDAVTKMLGKSEIPIGMQDQEDANADRQRNEKSELPDKKTFPITVGPRDKAVN